MEILDSALSAGAKVNIPALESFFHICEQSGNWKAAYYVFEVAVDETSYTNNTDVLKDEDDDRGRKLPMLSNDMVVSVMRTCNAAEQFGVAIFCAYLANLSRMNQFPMRLRNDVNYFDSNTDQMLRLCNDNSAHLTEIVASLCGMGQIERAVKLFHVVISLLNIDLSDDQWDNAKNHIKITKEKMANYASPNLRKQIEYWDNAFGQFESLAPALVPTEKPSSMKDDMSNLCVLLSDVMDSCTNSSHPHLGLIIVRKIARSFGHHTFDTSMLQHTWHDESDSMMIEKDLICSNDKLLCSTMQAFENIGQLDVAINLFFDKMKELEADPIVPNAAAVLANWPLSSSWCLRLLATIGDVDGAYNIFNNLEKFHLNDEIVLSMAQGFAAAERWEDVGNVWNTALNSVCLTEELGILALKSISNTEFDKNETKFVLFGEVVWEMAKLTGMTKEKWKNSHYWVLKKEIMDDDLVKMMGWKKGEIKESELFVAIEAFHKAKSKGENVSDEVLLSISKQAGYKQRHVRCRGNPIPDKNDKEHRIQQEFERNEGVEMLIEALHEARKTSLGDDPLFTLRIAQGLRALKANTETIEFVKELVSRGAEVRPITFLQGVFAATSLDDLKAKKDVITLMEASGATYEDHEETLRSGYS